MSILLPLIALTLGTPGAHATKEVVIDSLKSEARARLAAAQANADESSVHVVAKTEKGERTYIVTLQQSSAKELKAIEERMLSGASPLHAIKDVSRFPAGSRVYEGKISNRRARVVIFTPDTFIQTELELPWPGLSAKSEFPNWPAQMPICLKISGTILRRLNG